MRRAFAYAVLLGLLTGLVAGAAAFGLPLVPGGEAAVLPEPAAALLDLAGLDPARGALLAGLAILALATLAAGLDLRRVAFRSGRPAAGRRLATTSKA